MVDHQFALADLVPLYLYPVFIGFDRHIVPDAYWREHDSHSEGHAAADVGNPLEQIASLLRIGQRYESVADFDFHGVDLEQSLNALGGRTDIMTRQEP